MNITVVGTGYVGLVTGTCLSEVGHEVVCIDIDERKIDMLNQAKSPIYEQGLENLIQRNLTYGRLSFSTRLADGLAETDIVFIAVGTPEDEDGSADLRHVEKVAQAVGEHMPRDLLVVVKSTVPVGTCDKVQEILDSALRKRGAGFSARVASNPEFLQEGKAVADFMNPDRIIVGVTSDQDARIFAQLYRPFIIDDPARLLVMDRRSSELSKYASNAMLAARISFMNEMSQLCEVVGANVDNVRRGMGADPRIGKQFLFAGPGYGGSCFPKDVSALISSAEKHDIELSVLQATSKANQRQKEKVAQRILTTLGDKPAGKTVALWGLAFKPGTDDVRESPALTIASTLLSAGVRIHAHDPKAQVSFQAALGELPGVDAENLIYCQAAYECLEHADALVLVTEWPEYKWPNWKKVGQLMASNKLFDFRNQWDAGLLESLGFAYASIGRPAGNVDQQAATLG